MPDLALRTSSASWVVELIWVHMAGMERWWWCVWHVKSPPPTTEQRERASLLGIWDTIDPWPTATARCARRDLWEAPKDMAQSRTPLASAPRSCTGCAAKYSVHSTAAVLCCHHSARFGSNNARFVLGPKGQEKMALCRGGANWLTDYIPTLVNQNHKPLTDILQHGGRNRDASAQRQHMMTAASMKSKAINAHVTGFLCP
jgi:hypothetical protein